MTRSVSWRWVAIAVVALASGCGDDDAGACVLDTDCPGGMICGTDGSCRVRGGTDAGPGSDGGPGSDASPGIDGGTDGGAADAGLDAPADAGTDAGPPACDDLPGTYSVTAVAGDCGSVAAGQAITATRADNPAICVIEIASSDASEPVLDGSAPVEADGTFTETALAVAGTFDYECSGRFSRAGLEVTCTRTGGAETCTLTLSGPS
jgi:hypothetical protein